MRRQTLVAAAALIALATPTLAQSVAPPAGPAAAAAEAPQAPMTAAERKTVIETLAKTLEDNFVFPDVAKKYAAMLRANLASGAYDQLADPKDFAKRVTADLQAVSPDGHLRLALMSAFRGPPPGTAPMHGGAPLGLDETKMIGDVMYLDFNGFPGDPEEVKALRTFMLAHADAKAVIIDSRHNHGGGLDEIDVMAALLYPQRTTLVRMDTRAAVAVAHGDPLGNAPTIVKQPSPPEFDRRDHIAIPDPVEHRLSHVPVYYLVSHKTASAGEHAALVFKRTHRATLVGETTYGAGHYGGVEPIGDRFAAFIPVGRTYDPDTNWDWEGKGVAPDVAVPADQALDKALELAKAAGAHPN
ncbi:MAG TPA: S41 family peptidase [Caulobacteraceae bacterium]|jgi:hypothetical protein|nr:S41 family peptidase [Caulobacteraceae bacterium]